MARIEPDSLLTRDVPLQDGEKVLAEFRADPVAYWRGHLILAVVPDRVFVIKNLQAPGKTPFDVPTFQKTQTAVVLTPLGDKLTRVTVINSGYATGATWDGVYDFFRTGNAWTLAGLRDRFAKGPTDWAKANVPGTSGSK